jgi:hypothetical protein
LPTVSDQSRIDIANVATGIDGTAQTSIDWTVPDVNIYSNIYFFQFTRDGDVVRPPGAPAKHV